MTVPVDYPFGEPAPFAIRVPGGVLEIHGHGLTVTRYPHLPPLDACALDTAYYRDKATAFGHGDRLDEFVRWHELCHHLLARLLKLPCSPTLRGVALSKAGIGPHWGPWRVEEHAVEALHLFASACGVDLVRLAVEAAEREERG